MNDELLPCPNPKCGSTNVKAMTSTCTVTCRDCCECQITMATIEAAIAAWNTGRDPAKLDAFVKVVKAILPSNICFDTPKDRRLRDALAAFEGRDES